MKNGNQTEIIPVHKNIDLDPGILHAIKKRTGLL